MAADSQIMFRCTRTDPQRTSLGIARCFNGTDPGKGKNVRKTSTTNYRAITLSSILGKLFDRIVLTRYSDILATSQLQFGFKKQHSTAMCSMILKETNKTNIITRKYNLL